MKQRFKKFIKHVETREVRKDGNATITQRESNSD
jgi:hypothetical protein